MSEQSAWRIREAQSGDAEALALIGAATFLETFAGILDGAAIVNHCALHHCAAAYRDYLNGGARAWLAELSPGEAPIGYALIARPDLAAAVEGDCELKRIYTLSRFHGSGLGGALMDAALLGAAGHARLLLGVYAHNARALAFYRRNGFEKLADRQFNVGGKLYDDVVLARPLEPQLRNS